ncbi:hypothetical protein DEU56DRAFT_811163 [Suillus clintonianus]|uniref:uncharacterized protein n=1 Tax=Suillus clintonianus TaxID=1904413 RepID=UPI001B85F0D8|nr:uncharacterized protein DEU56DRAFT_811163 [Suillus clintonianus]KAG2133344.1 hypothetical protein DEU56DRAFT_811163 [Suillus clintonianus]
MPADYVVPRFDNTLGALLVGFAVSATAFGMLTIQVFTYYRRFPQDKAAYKALAALIWTISLVDQSFIGYAVYFYTITNYLDPLPLATGKPQWTLILQMTLGAVVGAIVKACFTLRVWRFSYRNWWLTGFLFLMVIAQLSTATVFTVKCFQISSFAHMIVLKSLGSISLGIGVVTDMSIAAALCFYLQKMRSSHTTTADSMINTLIIYAVNTGLLTSTISLSTLVLFNIMPTNFVFICMYFVLSKLYAISFLATLNTRKIIRGRGTDREGGKSTSFSMVTESMRPSVRIPMQLPMPTIREEYWQDVGRSHDSKFLTPSSTKPYSSGW